MKYSRDKAVNYALKWWNKHNPLYYNFENLGGDCTNFVSQCIFAGCGIMNFTKTFGWYYISPSNRSPSWTSVDFLQKFLLSNTTLGPVGRLCSLSEVEVGDIVQIRQGLYFNHTGIITKMSQAFPYTLDSVFITAHTYNVLNKSISLYKPKEVRLIKIVNVLS